MEEANDGSLRTGELFLHKYLRSELRACIWSAGRADSEFKMHVSGSR